MAERKCINEDLVRLSNGKATCHPRHWTYLQRGCGGCPKLSFGNNPIANSQPRSERNADIILRGLKADLPKRYR